MDLFLVGDIISATKSSSSLLISGGWRAREVIASWQYNLQSLIPSQEKKYLSTNWTKKPPPPSTNNPCLSYVIWEQVCQDWCHGIPDNIQEDEITCQCCQGSPQFYACLCTGAKKINTFFVMFRHSLYGIWHWVMTHLSTRNLHEKCYNLSYISSLASSVCKRHLETASISQKCGNYSPLKQLSRQKNRADWSSSRQVCTNVEW